MGSLPRQGVARLAIPDVSGMDVLSAALAYAAAGWYVGPCRGKHPGSVLGKGWQTKTSRDPRTIIDWFAGMPEGLGVFLHVGRSGAVAFDRDEMTDEAGEVIAACIVADAPRYTSRRDDLAHTTCVVLAPHAGVPSNRSPWPGLDVRGANGVIVAPPSPHPEPDGLYRWRTTGEVPPCPPMLAARLTPAAEAEATATDAEVEAFLSTCTRTVVDPDGRTKAMLERYEREARAGSRHQALVSVAPWFMRAAMAGVAGRDDIARLTGLHLSMLADATHPNGQRAGGDEVKGVLAWALAQARADPDLPESADAFLDSFAQRPQAAPQHDDGPDTPPGADGGAVGDVRSRGWSWSPMDPASLAEVVAAIGAGDYVAPAPSLGRVRGGGALLYPAKVHDIHGVGGGGKTFVAALIAAQVLADGDAVVWIDLEDSPATLVDRLLNAAGCAPEHLERLAYVRPVEPSGWGMDRLAETIADVRPALVVLDSTGEGLALDGVKPNDDDEVARWMRRVARSVADLGPAVLLLDHVPKTDATALLPIGSQRKQAALTGIAYSLQTRRPFSRSEPGWAVLVAGKDRQGFYKAGQVVARLDVDPHRLDGPVARLTGPPMDEGTQALRKREAGARLVEFLAQSPGTVTSAVASAVYGRNDYLATVLGELVAHLVVVRTPVPGTRGHYNRLADDHEAAFKAWSASLGAGEETPPAETAESQ